MANREPLVEGEWYHCFNRGVDKRKVFQTRADYERFISLMYICNNTQNKSVSSRRDTRLRSILSDASIRREPIVQIAAYALMPNHVHFIFHEIKKGGIAQFMQRVFTGYTMYFNKKNERAGALFAGAFKSKHIPDDDYFKHVMAYVLLNPADLFFPNWKEKGTVNGLEKALNEYPYASTFDFFGASRPEGKIVDFLKEEFYNEPPSLQRLLEDFQDGENVAR
jgi:REP element-mobilizing transposase RayT